MDGKSNANVSDIKRKFYGVALFVDILKIMVAHFVCILFTAFIIYTAQPGTSKLWISFDNDNCMETSH